jgi:putative membrane protein
VPQRPDQPEQPRPPERSGAAGEPFSTGEPVAADEPVPATELVPVEDQRRPRAVYGVGDEPDARFSLANERTALAWVRTGLGLVAGGVALTSLATFAELTVLLDVIAAVACLTGAAVAGYGWRTWRRNEIALRTGAPLPAPTALPVLAGGVVLMALVLAGYAVVSVV